MMRCFFVLLFSLFALNVSANCLKVLEPWVPAVPPGQTVMAGYMTLQNTSSQPVTLVSASSTQFKRVEFHRSVVENGMARMQAQQELIIAPGETLTLSPGGYHLMLIGLDTDLPVLETVDISLNFAAQGQQTIQAPVRMRGTTSEHQHHRH